MYKYKNHFLLAAVTIILLIYQTSCFSQNQIETESKMTILHNTIKINSSLEKVWEVLGNLTACNRWIPGVTEAKIDGMLRTCSTADGNIIKEKISNYSEKEHTYNYEHLQSPMPVKNSKGVFKIEHNEEGTLVIWDAEFEVLDQSKKEEISKMIDGYYKQTLETLKKLFE